MRIKYLILILCTFFVINTAKSQKLKFNSDTSYIRELSAHLSKAHKGFVDTAVMNMSEVWNTGKLSLPQKKQIINISNKLVNKRMRVFPHFYNYIKFILLSINSQSNSSHFDNWQAILEKYIADKSISTSKLNEIFLKIIDLNESQIIFKSRSVIWKTTSPSYTIDTKNNNSPQIGFGSCQLICNARQDSMCIYDTKGKYDFLSNIWTGNGGRLTWDYAGLPKDSVYANLNDYKIDLKYPALKVKSVKLIHQKYFSKELSGSLEMKILANRRGGKSPYPMFVSDSEIDIKDIMPNIDYSGGFRMQGSKIFGYATKRKNAYLYAKKDDEVFVKGITPNMFVFNNNIINGKEVKVSIKMGKDSLTHPGVNFLYQKDSCRINLTRLGGKFSRSRYNDSYHKMEIDVDLVSFQLNDTIIELGSIPMSHRVGIFESSNYFSDNKYRKIQLLDVKNPLSVIYNLTGEANSDCPKHALAETLGKSEKACYPLIYRLVNEGFIDYDDKTEIITAKQKLFDYVAAKNHKRDYDRITIISNSKNVNGKINLNTNDLTITGVKPFAFSYNRRVGVEPDSSTIVVKKDLDMEFAGKVSAGYVKVNGKDFKFNYKNFIIDFPKSDSINFYCKSDTLNADSVYEIKTICSPIENASGLIRIDKVTNKSGVDSLEQYPIIESNTSADVYYDQTNDADTVYNKEDFFFKTKEFVIDSLNYLTSKNLEFDGTLVSGDIFENIDQSLTIQEDNSLGFKHSTDKEKGLKIYGGKGTYYNDIKLDNKGLTGSGSIHYLNTDVYSSDIKFFTDSMNAVAYKIKMVKQTAPKTKYPKVETDSLSVHWEPNNDKMMLKTIQNPHIMFDGRVELYGTLQLEPKRLAGSGILQFLEAELNSQTFQFFDESFKTDSSEFKLKGVNGPVFPIVAKNINANIDLKKEEGLFKSNGQNSYVDFQITQYKCFMNYFTWRIKEKKIDIGFMRGKTEKITKHNTKKNTINLSDTSYTSRELAARSRFVSTNPAKDSLEFYAVSSTYDIDSSVIQAKNIKFMKVADMFLFPPDEITIGKDGNLHEIEGAKILANRTNNFHVFYNVNALVDGAKKYEASGDYEYVDRKEKVQQIHFDKIKTNENDSTIAFGAIEKEQAFTLSPEFAYYGDVYLEAYKKGLSFSGYTKINHSCTETLKSKWFQFNSLVDPDDVVIPLEEHLLSADTMKLSNGIFVTKTDSIGMYASFLTPKVKVRDSQIFGIKKGYVRYNDSTNYFEIADSAIFKDSNAHGNMYKLHKKLCMLIGEGRINLGVDLGQISTKIHGTVMHNLDSKETKFEAMMGLDFHFDKNAYKIMTEVFNEESTVEPVKLDSKTYLKNMQGFVGYEKAEEYKKGFALYGGYDQIPDSMDASIFISNIKLKWDNEHGAWVSQGKIGISNFKKYQILKQINGIMEVKRIGQRGVLSLYLEVKPGKWFFFKYDDGTLKTCSSSDEYNDKIAKVSDKKRSSTSKVTDVPFAYYSANSDSKNDFVRDMQKHYNFVVSEESEKAETGETEDFSFDDEIVDSDENNKQKKGKKKIKKNKKKEPVEEEPVEEEEEEEE